MSDYGGSIAANPRVALVDITQQGTDWLWAVFALMTVTGLGVVTWGHMIAPGRRAFHFMATIVLFTAATAYFCMASDLGATPITVEFVRNTGVTYTGTESPVTRSIWYVRYVDWAITTPMLLLTLLLGTGLPLSDIVITIFFDELMIVTGLVGALVQSSYKWGFWVFGTLAMFYVFAVLIGPARKSAYALSPEAGSAYTTSSLVLAGLWFIYPIIWGVADGGNVISPDSEMVAYGVLDVLAKPCFTLFHLWALSRVEYSTFALQSGHWSVGAQGASNNSIADEKGALHGSHAIGNGSANGLNGTNGHAEPKAAEPVTQTPPMTSTGHPNAAVHAQQQPEAFHQTSPPAGVVQSTTA